MQAVMMIPPPPQERSLCLVRATDAATHHHREAPLHPASGGRARRPTQSSSAGMPSSDNLGNLWIIMSSWGSYMSCRVL